jgi:peptidyl-prolyl cis-trans isomerase C
MMRLRVALLVCPMAFALAQTPPGSAQTPPESRQATPVPPPAGDKPAPQNGRSIPIPPPLPQVPPETVVLTIGDFKLTAAQFDAIADMLPEQSKLFVKGPGRKKFADQIAKVMILSEEAKRRKLDQTPDFQLQSQYRANEWLATILENGIRDSTKVDDASLREYYESHKSEFERVHARHILIRFHGSAVPMKPGGKDLSEEEALDQAKKLIARIKAGEDFAKIAMAESFDNGAATNGGDLGWFGHGQMLPSVEEAAFKLQPGEISDPVKSQFGYHIIKVEARESKSFDDVRESIEKKLKPVLTQKAVDDMEKGVKIDYDSTFFGLPKQ